MIVAVDTAVLVYLVDSQASAPLDPATGRPIPQARERIEYLVATLQKEKARLLVATPVLAEVLVRADAVAASRWIGDFQKSVVFQLADFDHRAAIEFAAMWRGRPWGKGRQPDLTRPQAKFDDQIVAIARVWNAKGLYADDNRLKRFAGPGFFVTGIADLPIPPKDPQQDLLSPRDP